MIVRGRITYQKKTVTGVDPYGAPVYSTENVTVPAELRPLGSIETVSAVNDTVTTRYRMFSNVDITADGATWFTWLGSSYKIAGDVEHHTIGGRLHHHEAIVVRYSG